ncbi:enoyl-CoA hydratase [Geobacillus sp. NFOSA3]|jgi:methylglutaconyl-CoA hydratase|uniref:Enoyl-CoA hydratase/carnithine racemase n=1 Tax=Parageobacillus toebii NBRC 107807 TaxID=1223503 RepID=A0A6G9J671_9BACL|nr:enoyl-CoA hydratase [Parageobacillus toebii]NNU94073.1 enoyl-CoA hydratase [Geobacillus sp. NFOSA3]OQO99363.1 enoyl-CoA hydratase [Geobacillus sp. 44C]MBB3869429.1 enoyl-CoA hydratase/carnithine racemase [Parageobacillus toebii NBRC 107807]MED4989292.1 enoyl-CoA hydratase [Parageobacillus toebii]QIQ33662.1 enoyl-CoA hydratase [Parageobacillus toebii NBRC 107807]
MSELVQYTALENGIAIITLNRPESANALSTALLYELSHLLYDLAFRRDVRVVIFTGAGEKVFCAGADLKERAGMNETEVRKTVTLIRETINQIEQLPQPVICALNGSAFGGGLELALACDIRVAADTAQLGLTETSLGIIPGAGGTQRLPRLIGKGKAKELIFTAKRITAKEAEQIGLVEYVVPREQLMEKAMEIAEQIVVNAPIAVMQAKIAINRGLDVDLATGLRIEQMAYDITIPTKDRLEGLQAFKEKRKPVYKGE